MKKTILGTLRALARELDNIPYVNCGGCGVVASAVASKLLNSPEVEDVSVVVLGWGADMDVVKAKVSDPYDIREWTRNGASFEHVVVRFKRLSKTWWFDSRGVRQDLPAKDDYRVAGEIPVDVAVAIAQRSENVSGWNTQFNRNRYIPKINSLCDTYLAKGA